MREFLNHARTAPLPSTGVAVCVGTMSVALGAKASVVDAKAPAAAAATVKSLVVSRGQQMLAVSGAAAELAWRRTARRLHVVCGWGGGVRVGRLV